MNIIIGLSTTVTVDGVVQDEPLLNSFVVVVPEPEPELEPDPLSTHTPTSTTQPKEILS